MRIDRFEHLDAWKEARALTLEIYRVSGQGVFGADFGLRNQIRRASVSVMSNIAEGFERFSPAEFRHFLRIALGSAAEVRSQLYVALDLGYLSQQEHERIAAGCRRVSRIVAALRSSIRSRS